MEWDKIYSLNRKKIEPTSPKFTMISDNYSTISIDIQITSEVIDLNPKIKELGQRSIYKSNKVIIELDDAKTIKEGEKITLVKWGNFIVESIS